MGKLLCRSEPEKIEPTSDCVGNEKTCKCCCKPSCDESKIVDECNPPTEPTARLVSSGEFNKWIIQFSISSFQINVESREVTRVNN